MKENTFWEVRKKLEPKKEEKLSTIKNKDGKLIKYQKDMVEEYKSFYNTLFKKTNTSTMTGKKEEEKIKKQMKTVRENAAKQKPMRITKTDIQTAVKKLKKKKATDVEGWKNEMVMEGGEEMKESIRRMFNQICEKNEKPERWERMKMKVNIQK